MQWGPEAQPLVKGPQAWPSWGGKGKRRNLDGLSPPDLAPAHTPHHWDPTWPRPFQNSSSLTGRLYDPGEASDPS